MKLTQKQKDQLWGQTGPYSQTQLTVETRILDDRISRIFINVDVNINPFTYKIIKQNRKEFKDNIEIQQLIDTAEYRGQNFGYVSCAFTDEFRNLSVMKSAQARLEQVNDMIIELHKFVMDFLDLS